MGLTTNILLKEPYILVLGAASQQGISFPGTGNQNLQFGTVSQVPQNCLTIAEGQSIMFDLAGSKTVVYSSIEYYLISTESIKLIELLAP